MPNPRVLELFRAHLPPPSIITDPAAVRPFETDGITAFRERPWVVVLPETVEQVRAILKISYDHDVPVVTRGAGTGLSGGARPIRDGILLTMSKMRAIVDVDLDACTATVEPGVTNLAISDAVRSHGLYYAPDPSSQIACSIGGNVAENSGGVHCLKYGLTVHNVLGIRVQTIEGKELILGGKTYDSPGYDLLALMMGSEGMLGVVTQVTVKLLPEPPDKRVLLGVYDELSKAGESVGDIIGAGVIPAGLEMMDALAIRAAEEYVHAGYPTDAAAILLCELDGSTSQVEADVVRVTEIMEAGGAINVRVAITDEERELFWKGRKAAFPAVGRLAPDYYCMDGSVPRHAIGRVLSEITRLSKAYQLPVANVFHAGDGNLHPLILFDSAVPGQLEQTEEFGGRILELCVEVGGTITGEHGVGVEKLDQMCVQFPVHELSQFHAVKAAWDSESLLNPGKAIPTLTRCAEFGAMHVHHGNMPHPELERF